MTRDIQQPHERRRWDVDRITSHGVKLHRIFGRTLVTGLGEVTFTVTFPITFVDTPAFSFGGELAPGSTVTAGSYPTISAVVKQWSTVPKDGNNTGFFYIGADIAVVVDGTDATQQMWVHWHFEGKAMRNPVSGAPGVTEIQ